VTQDNLQARPVVVVDFGAQYAQLIARRVREANCFSEVVPSTMPVGELLAKDPAAIILSGGPSSVYEEGAPSLDPALLEAGVPVFGMCYGFQSMAQALGGSVEKTGLSEFGATQAMVSDTTSTLFNGQPDEQSVWMSHGDSVAVAPEGMRVTATTAGAPVAAFEDDARRLYGVQWHPEVMHSTFGQQVLENFLRRGAGLAGDWTAANVVEELVEQVRSTVGEARVICGLSGGVDSSVAAALVQRAVGDQLTCVFVDHGLLRAGEAEQVEKDFVDATGVDLVVVDAQDRFLSALAGVSDPEEKRKIIGREFIRVFEQAARDIVGAHSGADDHPVEFLVQGTLYPDVVESGGGTGHRQHQVAPQCRRTARRPAVQAGRAAEAALQGRGAPGRPRTRRPRRHRLAPALPGAGAGHPDRREPSTGSGSTSCGRPMRSLARNSPLAGLDRDIWQCPVVLLADVRSVGVQGDGRTYGHPVVLRPGASEDAMTADWARVPYDVLAKISTRITNEVREINRVVLDVTSKPPGTIEWE
jgi:GMP synthase (glutamine-hydrolysing)